MLDRFDIHVEVPTIKYEELEANVKSEKSKDIKKRVEAARQIQLDRYKDKKIYTNSNLAPADMEKYCHLTDDCKDILRNVFEKLGLSARAHDRIIKVSRTIADLEGKESIEVKHIAEAVRYRSLDKKFWFK